MFPSFTANDMYKMAGIIFFCGTLYFKIDNACVQLKSVSDDLKESHSRIEKLELSVAKIQLQIDEIKYEDDKRFRTEAAGAVGGK